METMIIAVDFDGTIVQDVMPAIGQPVPGAIRWLTAWQRAGAELVLWTCRRGELLGAAVEFLAGNNIIFDYVNDHHSGWSQGRKIFADIYVDDHALGVPLLWPGSESVPYVNWGMVGPWVMERIMKGHKYECPM